MNSGDEKVFTKKPICNVLKKVIATVYLLQIFLQIDSKNFETLEKLETYFSS